MENRHIRTSISITLMIIVAIACYVAIGTENTLLCVVSFLIAVGGFALGNKLGI